MHIFCYQVGKRLCTRKSERSLQLGNEEPQDEGGQGHPDYESESLVFIIVTFLVISCVLFVLGSVLEKVSFDSSGEKKEFNMILS